MIGRPLSALIAPEGPSSGAGRRARAVAFALVSVTLAAVAHVIGGDMLPPWWVLLGSVWALQLAAVPLASRERGFVFLATAMVTVQLALHMAFSLAMNHSGMAGMAGMTSAMSPHLDPVLQTTKAWCGTTSTASMGLLPAAGWMLFAHIVAAVGVAAWLRLGERRFFAAAARWSSHAELALRAAVECLCGLWALAGALLSPSAPRRSRRPNHVPPRRLIGLQLAARLGLRGPPSPLLG